MKYLGVDYGLKKIGLAVSEGSLASPLQILHVSGKEDALAKLQQVIKQEGIDLVVIGVPDSGVRGAILKVVNKLRETVEVVITDETLSSKVALEKMVQLNLSQKKRSLEDAYAAAEILQNYLDHI